MDWRRLRAELVPRDSRGRRRQAGVALFVALCVASFTCVGAIAREILDPAIPGVRDQASLRRVAAAGRHSPFPSSGFTYSLDDCETILTAARGIAAGGFCYGPSDVLVTAGDVRDEHTLMAVSEGYSDVLGVVPAAGRLSLRGSGYDVVISERAAVRYFGSIRSAVGRTLTIDGLPWNVIGVARRFRGLDREPADLFIPLRSFSNLPGGERWLRPAATWLYVVLRNAPSLAAGSLVERLRQRLGNAPVSFDPATLTTPDIRLERAMRGPLNLVAAASALMGMALVIVLFTNLTQFFLLRGSKRAHELVLRRVLGASALDLFTLLGLEAAAPLAVGAVGGMVVGQFAASRLVQYVLGPDAAPEVFLFGDTRVAWAILCLCVVAAAVPAVAGLKIRQLRRAIELTHKPMASSRGVAEVLLGVQLLLATAIIVVTYTIAANVSAIARIDYGTDVRHLYALRAVSTLSALDSSDVTRVADRMRSVPGVRQLSIIEGVPFRTSSWEDLYVRGSHPEHPASYSAESHQVDREFFATSGLHVTWRSADARSLWSAGDSVVVLSRGAYSQIATAEHTPPECVSVGGEELPCKTIVGIADDARFISFSMVPQPAVYELAGMPPVNPGLLVSATGPSGTVVARLNAAAQGALPASRPAKFESAYEVVEAQSRPWRSALPILVWLCGLAVIITGLGIAAVAAAHVERLRRSLAIRSALGAPTRVIVSNAIGRACITAAAGIGAGLGVGALVSFRESLLLFDMHPMSAVIVIPTIATALMAVGAGLALPMRTVLRVSPREAMAVTS